MFMLVLILLGCGACALADTEFILEPCAGRMALNEDTFIVLTPSNLSDHPDLLASIGQTREDLLADWEARGVQLQAWTRKMDSCLEVTVIQDEESRKYYDLEQKTRQERNEYLKLHQGSGRCKEQGFTILKPEWKKQKLGGNFLKFEYKRTVGEKTWRGYARKTVRNGYTIMLDYQAFDRLPRRTDEDNLNKIANTVSFEVRDQLQAVQEAAPSDSSSNAGGVDVSATEAGLLKLTVLPPDQTNSDTFTLEGTTLPDMHIIVVAMRLSGAVARFSADASAKGNFKVKIILPEEGLWQFTINLEKDGTPVAEDYLKQTKYSKVLLPIELDAEIPEQLSSDELVISGTTDKGVSIQCIVTNGQQTSFNNSVKTNGTGKFKFKIPTSLEADYDIVLSFQKKGLNNERLAFHTTRKLTEADNQARAVSKAIHPSYNALVKNLDSYIGQTMVYTVHIVEVTQVGEEWQIKTTLKKNKGTYSSIMYFMADQDPMLEEGAKVRIYGTCIGGHLVQSEEETVAWPGFDFISYE